MTCSAGNTPETAKAVSMAMRVDLEQDSAGAVTAVVATLPRDGLVYSGSSKVSRGGDNWGMALSMATEEAVRAAFRALKASP